MSDRLMQTPHFGIAGRGRLGGGPGQGGYLDPAGIVKRGWSKTVGGHWAASSRRTRCVELRGEMLWMMIKCMV